jgi:hypothetical protein
MPSAALRHASLMLVCLSVPTLAARPVPEVPPPPEPRTYFTEPAIAPDRSEIAFASGGDLWSVPTAGGDAWLLVSHPANVSRPVYSPDGRTLAFVSDRTGGGDIYILTLENGDLRRLTFDDGNELLDGWSRDGQWIYYSASSREIAGNDIYRVRVAGGMPMPVTAERSTNEFAATRARENVMADIGALISQLRLLTSAEPRSVKDGIATLRQVRRQSYEDLNQVQHESLIVEAADWLQARHPIPLSATWYWNPRQTGDASEPDLAVYVDGQQTIAAEGDDVADAHRRYRQTDGIHA